jgi:hypothetical protein
MPSTLYEKHLGLPKHNFIVPLIKYIISVDLGTSVDFTAVAAISKEVYGSQSKDDWSFHDGEFWQEPKTTYSLLRIKRLPLGLDYTTIINHIAALKAQTDEYCQQFRPYHDSDLVLDATGVGRPVVDMFTKAGFKPVAITISGGQEPVNHGSRRWSVPRTTLLMGLRTAFEGGELMVNSNQPEAELLKREMGNLAPHYSPAGNLTFQHRVGQHDDLTLSLAQGIWWARHHTKFGEPHLRILEG